MVSKTHWIDLLDKKQLILHDANSLKDEMTLKHRV